MFATGKVSTQNNKTNEIKEHFGTFGVLSFLNEAGLWSESKESKSVQIYFGTLLLYDLSFFSHDAFHRELCTDCCNTNTFTTLLEKMLSYIFATLQNNEQY